MTKLKNTKKGMAKKALSVSLVAAMLATSNVPVWAAEDLFSDGSAAVEAPTAEVETFSSEPAEVEEAQTAAPLADNEDVTVDVQIYENGWGYFAGVDSSHATITADGITKVMYYWTVNGQQVTEEAWVEISNLSTLKYVPTKEQCGGTLGLVIYRPDDQSTPFTWTSQGVTISKRDIAKNTTTANTNISVQTKTVSYDGKEHQDANDWISAITFGDVNTDGKVLTYDPVNGGDFDVTVTGTKGLENCNSNITITIQPRDKEYYTGEYVISNQKITPISWKNDDGTLNFKAEFVNKEFEYTGSAIKLEKDDIKVTELLSNDGAGTVLDSEEVIENVWDGQASGAVDVGEYPAAVSLVKDKLPNYKDVPEQVSNKELVVEGKWKIVKRDLANTKITLNAIQAQTTQITDTQVKAAFDTDKVTDLDGNKITGLTTDDFDVKNIQDNSGQPGYYTATLVAKSTSTNFKGELDITFRVYNKALNASFDGKLEDGTVYATAPEEYTGEPITKDLSKLGDLRLNGENTKLTPGTSYDTNFVYSDNTDAGTATFVVKGLNDYAGSEKTFTFTINPASVSDDDVTVPEKVTYNSDYTEAKDYAPEVTVIAKNGATPAKEFTLVEGTDYKVTYTFEANADDDLANDGKNAYNQYVCAHVEITNDNFKGGQTDFKVFSKITKPQVSNWTVSTVSPSYTYTGEAIIPELIVKDGNKELELGVDYEIRSVANGTNVGTATVILAGKGDYDSDSTITTTFEITPAETEDLVVNVDDMEYTGQRIRPAYVGQNSQNDGITEVKLGDVSIDINQFTITYPDSASENKEIGTGTFTLTPKSTNKNFTGTKTVTFNIVGKKIKAEKDDLKVYNADGTEVDVENIDRLYNGTAFTFADAEFSYIYKDETTGRSVTLEEGKDFEIKYFHNVYGDKKTDNAASGVAYIAVVGKGNYAGDGDTYVFEDENGQKVNAIVYRTFDIESVKLTSANVTVSNGEYAEGMPVKPVVTVKYGRDTLTLEEGKDYKLNLSGVYTEPTTTKKYTVDVTGINGYTGLVRDNKWGIDKKDLADCDVTATRDDAGNVTVIVMNGSVVVDSSKYVIKTDAANDTVTVTPAADSKYYTGSAVVAIQGDNPAEKPAAPVIESVNVSGNNATVVLSGESDGATGYDYVISTDRNCINTKDYDKVNKNVLNTQTTFTYTQQGVYYAYCHAWKRVDGVKVFSDWSDAYPFSVTALTPEQPVITSVKKSGRNLTVTWTQSENATTGYDVVMGTAMRKVNGEMRPVEYGKAVKKVGPNTFSVTFKSIPKGTYYVGLHAHNRTSESGVKVFSPWSNAKKVTF